MSTQDSSGLEAGYEKKTIQNAVEKVYAVYASDTSDSPGGDKYPCTRVLNRLFWYRRKIIRCKLGYHLLSILIVIMPLAATAIKLLQGAPNTMKPLDYVGILLTFLTSALAFILGHFRFLEKWKRYRKILEESIHICSDALVDNTKVDYAATVELLKNLELLFKEDTREWTPDESEKKK